MRKLPSAAKARSRKSLIVFWTHGGLSQQDTYDMKPDAPAEFRGPYRPIATSVAEEPETIEDVHEPFLIQNGLLARTARGRVATERAYRHLGLEPPPPSPVQGSLL